MGRTGLKAHLRDCTARIRLSSADQFVHCGMSICWRWNFGQLCRKHWLLSALQLHLIICRYYDIQITSLLISGGDFLPLNRRLNYCFMLGNRYSSFQKANVVKSFIIFSFLLWLYFSSESAEHTEWQWVKARARDSPQGVIRALENNIPLIMQQASGYPSGLPYINSGRHGAYFLWLYSSGIQQWANAVLF